MAETDANQTSAGPSVQGVHLGSGGEPLTVGLIFFGIASLALGMALIGVPSGALGGVVPVIVFGAGLFQLIVTFWAIFLGQSIVALIFSTFSAYWLSQGALLVGLAHNWYGVPAASVSGVQEIFFISWACLFLFLIIPCLRLPVVFTLAVTLVFVALAVAAAAVFTSSSTLFTVAGCVALTFAFLAFYSYAEVAMVAAGGKSILPLGKPPLS